MKFNSKLLLIGLILPALTLAGCDATTSSMKKDSEKAIKTADMSSKVGSTIVSSDCDKPSSTDVGTKFKCTAKTENGKGLNFVVTVDAKNHIDARTRNVFVDSDITTLNTYIKTAIESKGDVALENDAVDCGKAPIIVDTDKNELVCKVVEPGTGDVYDATISFTKTSDDMLEPSGVEVASTPN